MQRIASVARFCVKCTSTRSQSFTYKPSTINPIHSKLRVLSFHSSSIARSDKTENDEVDGTENDEVDEIENDEVDETENEEVDEALEEFRDEIDNLTDEQFEAEFDAATKGMSDAEIEAYTAKLVQEESQSSAEAIEALQESALAALDVDPKQEAELKAEQEFIQERDRKPKVSDLGSKTVHHKDGSVEFKVHPGLISHHFDDATAYSDNIEHIDQRLAQDKPLTTTQKITLMKKWLADIEADPRTAFKAPQPMISWTHPTEPGARPGRHPPRLQEKFVEYDYKPEIVKSMSAEEQRKARRGTVSEWILERRVYENKMHDVRKFYMAEFQEAKKRREARILREWRATKAAKQVRVNERKIRQAAGAIALRAAERAALEQRLSNKRDRVSSRVNHEAKIEARKAEVLTRLMKERKQSWVNTDESNPDWGMKIDEALFLKTETNITGFWPKRKIEDEWHGTSVPEKIVGAKSDESASA